MHIVCIMMNPEYAFWALCGRGIQDQADEHGITLSIRPVETNDEAQVQFLDCLRQPHVDAVIIVACTCFLPDHGAAGGVLPIPVINCNGVMQGRPAACDLQPDLRRAAELAAGYLVER